MITAASFRELHDELAALGSFEAPTFRSWLKFLICAGVSLAVVAQVYVASSAWALLWLLPASLLMGAAIMIGHEAAHGAACEKAWQNDLLVAVGFGTLSGVSSLFWKHKHNVLHHGSPNVPGKDRDLLLGPIAVTKEQYDTRPMFQWFARNLQGYLMWPLSAFLAPLMRVRTFTILSQAALAGKIDRVWVIDVVAVSLHYVLWLGIPTYYFGFAWSFAVYFVVFSGVSLMLSYIFMLGHTGLPLAGEWDDRWSLQILTSRNVRLGPVGRFFWVGLDAQLTHHLFPKISHFKLPATRDAVNRWCARHGFAYIEQDVVSSTVDVARHLFVSWKDVPVDLRRAPAAE